jgi:hypothetical protein
MLALKAGGDSRVAAQTLDPGLPLGIYAMRARAIVGACHSRESYDARLCSYADLVGEQLVGIDGVRRIWRHCQSEHTPSLH